MQGHREESAPWTVSLCYYVHTGSWPVLPLPRPLFSSVNYFHVNLIFLRVRIFFIVKIYSQKCQTKNQYDLHGHANLGAQLVFP